MSHLHHIFVAALALSLSLRLGVAEIKLADVRGLPHTKFLNNPNSWQKDCCEDCKCPWYLTANMNLTPADSIYLQKEIFDDFRLLFYGDSWMREVYKGLLYHVHGNTTAGKYFTQPESTPDRPNNNTWGRQVHPKFISMSNHERRYCWPGGKQ